MAFKMKGSPIKLGSIATKSALEQASPMKSLFGLGKDNREARQFNREARKIDRENRRQYRADKKAWRKDKRDANKQYRQDMRDYKASAPFSKGKNLSQAERRYFMENQDMYSDWAGGPHGTGDPHLKNPNTKEGRKRRNEIREAFANEYALENMPVKRNVGLKPIKPEKTERAKLDTSVTFTRPETLRERSTRLHDEGVAGY